MNWIKRLLLPMVLLPFFAQLLPAENEMPTDAEIKDVLRERIDTAKMGVGIVVGIVDEKGPRIIAYGKTSNEKGRDVDGDTIFEIGSVTKVFTSLLLADMVEHGDVKLDDPVSKFLPASVKVPSRDGRQITLVDLSTHTSGLPRVPDNLMPADEANPYADYTVANLYEFLSSYELPRDIGSKYEYSNVGGGLLGHVLALKAGTNYESLVKQRICAPLEMSNTCITLSPEQHEHLAHGHDMECSPAPNWDLLTLAGAGALRSTANDLLKFVSANMGRTKSPLGPAMELMQKPRHSAGPKYIHVGLGWHIATKYDEELIWHNGETGGYHSFIGFDKKEQRGVVVLANTENSIDDIGFHLLESKYNLLKVEPVTNHVVVKLDSKTLDHYAGRYEFAPEVFYIVKRHGDHLQGQLSGQPFADIYPETTNQFFYKIVNAQVTFHDAQGDEPASLVLHQNGIDQTAKKVSDDAPKERVAIQLDPKIYDSYAGRYELAPEAAFTIRHEGSRLMAQLTGQPYFEVFPESETNFFYKVVDAQLSFVKNEKGEVTALVLHQNGVDQKAAKVK